MTGKEGKSIFRHIVRTGVSAARTAEHAGRVVTSHAGEGVHILNTGERVGKHFLAISTRTVATGIATGAALLALSVGGEVAAAHFFDASLSSIDMSLNFSVPALATVAGLLGGGVLGLRKGFHNAKNVEIQTFQDNRKGSKGSLTDVADAARETARHAGNAVKETKPHVGRRSRS